MTSLERVTTTDTLSSDAIGGEHLGRRYYLSLRFMGTVFGTSLSLCSAYAAYLLPVGILSYINADIGPDPNYVWIPLVWTICVALSYTLVGRLSDIFGRRYFIVGGNCLGLIGAIIAATANNIPTLIGASLFIGFAAAVQLSYTMIVGELVPIKHRGYWYFITLVPVIPFAFFGAYLSHNFLQIATWRWCYYLCIILQGSACVLMAVSYFPPSFSKLHTVKTRRQLINEIDYLGVFLFTAGFTLFLLGISWGGGYYPWKSAAVIATIVVGAVLIVLFFVWEANCKSRTPFLPWPFFVGEPRRFLLPLITGTVGGMFYYGLTIVWPLQVNAIYSQGVSLREQGWLASVLACGAQSGTMLASLAFKPLGHHRIQLVLSYVFMIGFAAGLTQANIGNRSVSLACAFCTGLGIGFVETIVILIAQVGKDPVNIGLVIGTIGSFRSIGGAVAQAVYTTILTNKLTTEIPGHVTPAALGAGLPAKSLPALYEALATQSAAAFKAVPGITLAVIGAVEAAEVQAYVQSFKYVYYACIAFGCVGFLTALFITKDVDKDMTDFVAKKLEGVVLPDEEKNIDIDKSHAETFETVDETPSKPESRARAG